MSRHAWSRSQPGGVAISGWVHEAVAGKIDGSFEDRGEQQVKNIARPVRVYAVAGAAPVKSQSKPLPLPDKPSIAVLPFTNMSGDPEQEYFADGVVEEIITALSHFQSLFVTAGSVCSGRKRAKEPKPSADHRTAY
jgi:adenylate cyclase